MSNLKFPLVPLRGITVFPNMVISFPVGRARSLEALEAAEKKDNLVFLITQIDPGVNDPEAMDLYSIGTVARVKQILKLPGNTTHCIVEGVSRGFFEGTSHDDECIYALVSQAESDDREDYRENIQVSALMRLATEKFDEYVRFRGKAETNDAVVNVTSAKNPGQLADIIASALNIEIDEKQKLLGNLDRLGRLGEVINILHRELEILKLKNEIDRKVRAQMEEAQKEYYLREQIKVIQQQLGDKDGIQKLTEDFKAKAETKKLPDYAKEVVIKESDRLAKMNIVSPEANVIRNYVEFILDMPWEEASEEIQDIKRSAAILEEDHYGLERVKERILEHIAVKQNTKENSATIICLVGPPGVGKTSIAKSVARATGREYVRMSLGGVKDESEIRGHRRTYVGAMSGRILNAVKQAGTVNPLILLDEVDKLSVSYNGDPSAALLEVLDGEQNNNFRDHFLEIPYDLSRVLFLCTANSVDKIPGPLRDRMEVIQLSSYTLNEKMSIAEDYLYPKQLKAAGLTRRQLKIDEDMFQAVISNYTKEAGVRNLERTIGRICRKAVREILSGRKKTIRLTEKNIEDYLGAPKNRIHAANIEPKVGVVRGLAWTAVGGDTLEIEANIMKGSGKFEMTGNVGNVMKESARAAITYLRSNEDKIKVEENFYKELDIHIHIPEGAVPKDGPSAGVSMATALVSALTHTKVRNDVAMTGEITITGRVLPIGGLKEKVIAAKQAGITTVILPYDNRSDLAEIDQDIREEMNFVLAKEITDVFDGAMAKGENIWK